MLPPVLSREQVRQVDRRAIDEFGMSGLVLMENAGRGCADTLCRLGIDGVVLVCCGKGNNAGDGFVIARHLDLRGMAVKVLMWAPAEELQGDAAANYRILSKSNVPIVSMVDDDGTLLTSHLTGSEPARVDWIVDALLGTGARGDPRPPLDAVIERINAHPLRKLAVDLPSGLDCDSGQPGKPTFRADHTCTFVAVKPGFLIPGAAQYTGQVHVLDIGTPRKLIEEVLAEANG